MSNPSKYKVLVNTPWGYMENEWVKWITYSFIKRKLWNLVKREREMFGMLGKIKGEKRIGTSNRFGPHW